MAVLMSLENFASYEETGHLLESAGNAERLLEAIGELERDEEAGPQRARQRTALIEGDEPRPFDFDSFLTKRRKAAPHRR